MVKDDIPDKVGGELAEQRFRMLADIAEELKGELVFPTCFDTAEQLRRLMDDPEVSIDIVAAAVGLDPLVGARLVQLANSVALGGSGSPVRDVRSAINRLGLARVRSASLAIAIRQLMMSREMAAFAEFTRHLWQHSLTAACAAQIVARRMTRFNADEAFLAGMVHDLGAFYMLHRAVRYPELVARPDTLRHLIIKWHESIGVTLLGTLGLAEEIVEAAGDHDQPRPVPPVPRNLRDVVYVANIIAGAMFEWRLQDIAPDRAGAEAAVLPAAYTELEEEIGELVDSMGAVLA